ncbi:MAG: hypothetical protein Q3983_04055 [Capnocytophaga sp.]|nr:hypothetical protein [Capnocytophaga sp.]
MLFWNLWNISYPFDVLTEYKNNYHQEYILFNEMYLFCWSILNQVDKKNDGFEFIFGQNYPFIIDEETGETVNPKGILQQKYESYDDDILPELCIRLLIGRFDEIYKGIKEREEKYGERATNAPMEAISSIIASYNWGYLFDNMDRDIVIDEVNAQIKLVKMLQTPHLFTLEDRNIFRNKEFLYKLLK